MSKVDFTVAAYHEAGRAVVGLLYGRLIRNVSISSEIPGNGLVRFNGIWRSDNRHAAISDDAVAAWKQVLARTETTVKTDLAGPLEEARLLGITLR